MKENLYGLVLYFLHQQISRAPLFFLLLIMLTQIDPRNRRDDFVRGFNFLLRQFSEFSNFERTQDQESMDQNSFPPRFMMLFSNLNY